MPTVHRLFPRIGSKSNSKVSRSFRTSAIFAAVLSAPVGAITFSHPEIYSPDPTISADFVTTPHIDPAGNFNFVLRDPISGRHDHHQISASGTGWSAVGSDGLVVGGTWALPKAGPSVPSTEACVGPWLVACAAGLIAAREAICEMRATMRIRRASRQCSIGGHGTEVTQQTGCGNVQTRCIITGRPVQVQ